MKQDATIVQNEINLLAVKSEQVIHKIRDDYRHGNISLYQRTYLISDENPTRVNINERGVKYMERNNHIMSIESELNAAFEQLNALGTQTDDVFYTIMRNIDHRIDNITLLM
jgi:hypothetical protein